MFSKAFIMDKLAVHVGDHLSITFNFLVDFADSWKVPLKGWSTSHTPLSGCKLLRLKELAQAMQKSSTIFPWNNLTFESTIWIIRFSWTFQRLAEICWEKVIHPTSCTRLKHFLVYNTLNCWGQSFIDDGWWFYSFMIIRWSRGNFSSKL